MHAQGGNSEYEFNVDDFSDPYSDEAIANELARRGPDGLPVEKGTFFNVDEAAPEDF